MSEMFWESVQKARKEHFCDWCHNWIEVGDTYSRSVWVPRKGSFHVLREHVEPECPPNVGTEILNELLLKERAAVGVPIVFVAEVRQVLKVGLDGEAIVEPEHHFAPKLVCEAIPDDETTDDSEITEDIPF